MKNGLGLPQHIPPLDIVTKLTSAGPWKSKSGGNLKVHVKMSLPEVSKYLSYDEEELKEIPEDIRGIRIYTVSNMPLRSIGGKEFHRIRKELFIVMHGSLDCICEDLFGNTQTFTLNEGDGVRIHPFIMHTVVAQQENTGFMVVANTLFDPDNPETHDSYPQEEFNRLKKLMD